jgi:hypothetical protein
VTGRPPNDSLLMAWWREAWWCYEEASQGSDEIPVKLAFEQVTVWQHDHFSFSTRRKGKAE